MQKDRGPLLQPHYTDEAMMQTGRQDLQFARLDLSLFAKFELLSELEPNCRACRSTMDEGLMASGSHSPRTSKGLSPVARSKTFAVREHGKKLKGCATVSLFMTLLVQNLLEVREQRTGCRPKSPPAVLSKRLLLSYSPASSS